MTWQISDWGKYTDLLRQLDSMQLDWSTWANLTSSIITADAGVWGAVPENVMYGHGLAELLGEIYQVQPGDVDLDDASQLKATDNHVLSMLWHIVNAQPAAEVRGYEDWDGYFICEEPDGSLVCATARDAEEWSPATAADDYEADDGEEGEDDWDVAEASEQEPEAADEAPGEQVGAAVFATTADAQEGAELVTDMVQETLNQVVTALPAEVIAALGQQDLENLAVEASKAVAAEG